MHARPLAYLVAVLFLPASAQSAPATPVPSTEPTPEPRLTPALLTPAQLLSNLVDVLPSRPEANRQELFPVGFSSDGAFAYISNAYYSELGGAAWSFVVHDLVTDKQVLRLPPIDAPLVQTLEEGISAHRAAIEGALKTHGITARARLHAVPAGADPTRRIWDPKSDPQLPPDTPLLRPFPLFVGATACSVDAAIKPDDTFALTVRCGDGAKPLGTVWTSVAGPVAIGALISPHEPRVAVIVQTAQWALHGSDPMHLNYTVFGAHLEDGFEPTGPR
jgi:hypothetical protein